VKSNHSPLLEKLQPRPPRKLNDHILLVDALNTFIRSFATVNYINPQGNHIGGLAGFLKSLAYMVRVHEPTRVVVVFDGRGSTVNRKNIDPSYKAQRSLTRITNWEIYEDKDAERESMSTQIERLVEYLQCLPVQMVSVDKVEADDIIALIAKIYSQNSKKATIVSSDKDFLQLVDSNIEVYSPIKKKLYTESLVIEEFKTTPSNFLIGKAILGDQSDNLPGVTRVGAKTLHKLFPNLSTVNLTLEDVFRECEGKYETNKGYLAILNQKDRVETNYELMNLLTPNVPDYEIETIRELLTGSNTTLNTMAFEMLYESDNMNASVSQNITSWLEVFRNLTTFKK
jgi:DNA polymerase-1